MDSYISYNQYMVITIWVNLLVVIIMPQVHLFIVMYAPNQILLKRDLMM